MAIFEMSSNTDANFLNLHIDEARKTHDDKKTSFNNTFHKINLNLNYLLPMLNVTEQFLNSPKQRG